jgi:protein-tyrosine phosphatase
VIDTLEAAVWCLLTTNSYKECVLKAVNLGDDTDTVAAVAGGLAGALYGLEGIPQEWLDTLIKREYIEAMCERASVAWIPPEDPIIKCEYPVVDLHIHVVPDVDDGSRNINESLEMLELAEKQGVTDVFCTTHNGYSAEDREEYDKAFELLQQAVKEAEIDVKLHKGCEILCAAQYIDDIIYGLDEGIFPTLGNTKYVLTELYPDAKPSEAIQIIKELVEHGYHPIIAHMERNFNITGAMVGVLIQNGAMIQVNAFSFQDESDEEYQRRAKELLSNRYVHFIGSDAHRINHRPPKVDSGIQYILNNIELEYAKDILYENARKHLNIGAVQES